ncbi:hypothetical protein LNP74_27340 [Klebsiella pneumoniae subsp. pneumoniae]|nr:hypothetical protein [Klebsiella pneumoniae subsp. pneumoniae]
MQAGCGSLGIPVCGGLFPRCSLALVRAIRSGDVAQTAALNEQLAPYGDALIAMVVACE